MKKFSGTIAVIFVVLILLSSCTSVPSVLSPNEVESKDGVKVYAVRISSDVDKEEARKYAINPWVWNHTMQC